MPILIGDVPCGGVAVELQVVGYEVKSPGSVTIEDGSTQDVRMACTPQPAKITVDCAAPGAEVWAGGKKLATAGVAFSQQAFAPLAVEVRARELQPELVRIPALNPGETRKISVAMHRSLSALTQPRTNSLGMVFVPVSGLTNVLFCIWETRVQDYRTFIRATGNPWSLPGFQQGPDHPVVNVCWKDARDFCQWLTKTEQSAGLIATTQAYRLPGDAEWSIAVGLEDETGTTPAAKSARAGSRYLWDGPWPPPRGVGNYDPKRGTDDFEHTSPVGSFAANKHGLFDMGGNAWEWCDDPFDGSSTATRTLRGAAWNVGSPGPALSIRRMKNPTEEKMLITYRRDGAIVSRDESYGFRVVLAQVP